MSALAASAARIGARPDDRLGLVAFEIRLAARSRWLWVGAVAMAALSGAVTAFGLSAFRQLGLAAAAPAAVALLSVMLLVPSAFAIIVGSAAFASDRGGFSDMLLAAGVSGTRIALAKLAGVLVLSFSLVLSGFGAAALVLTGSASAADLATYAALLFVALLVTAALAAMGVLIASLARRGGHPVAVALGVWLVLALGLDLAVFAIAPFVRVGIPFLFALIALDPIESGRVLGLLVLGGDSALLGPLGSFARNTLGVGLTAGLIVLVDALWVGFATLASGAAIARRF